MTRAAPTALWGLTIATIIFSVGTICYGFAIGGIYLSIAASYTFGTYTYATSCCFPSTIQQYGYTSCGYFNGRYYYQYSSSGSYCYSGTAPFFSYVGASFLIGAIFSVLILIVSIIALVKLRQLSVALAASPQHAARLGVCCGPDGGCGGVSGVDVQAQAGNSRGSYPPSAGVPIPTYPSAAGAQVTEPPDFYKHPPLQQAPPGNYPAQPQQAPPGYYPAQPQQAPPGYYPAQPQQAPPVYYPAQPQQAPPGYYPAQPQQQQAPPGYYPAQPQQQQAPPGYNPGQQQGYNLRQPPPPPPPPQYASATQVYNVAHNVGRVAPPAYAHPADQPTQQQPVAPPPPPAYAQLQMKEQPLSSESEPAPHT